MWNKGGGFTMGKIDYRKIYETNKDEWKALTREPQKYEALLAGHYSDSNHFVYELLQNAEDARAARVVIEYHGDKLVFYHDGKPFDEGDVKGVSSMLMGTKDKMMLQRLVNLVWVLSLYLSTHINRKYIPMKRLFV